MVPECSEGINGQPKPNKGIVLRKSADYIRYLQETNRKLQMLLVQQPQNLQNLQNLQNSTQMAFTGDSPNIKVEQTTLEDNQLEI